jgi:hypothetical protein
MTQSYEREIGRLQAEMENSTSNQKRIEEKLDAHAELSTKRHEQLETKIDEKFAELEALLNQGKGAWKVVIVVAGAAGSIATLVGTKLFTVLSLFK